MHYIYLKTYDLKLVIQEPFIQKIFFKIIRFKSCI